MGSATKPCPFCAEKIAVEAKKCRHCNEWLDQGAEARNQITWQGSRIVLPKTARLPKDSCWICGGEGPDMAPKRKTYYYAPPWVYLGLLGGLLPAIVLVLLFQKSAELALPLCGPCRKRWTTSELTYGVFAVLGFFGLPALFAVVGNAVARDAGLGLGILGGFLAWIAGLVAINFTLRVKSQITCTRIENDLVTLQLPNPAATRKALRDRAEP